MTEPSIDTGGGAIINIKKIDNNIPKISEHISELDFLSTTQTPDNKNGDHE